MPRCVPLLVLLVASCAPPAPDLRGTIDKRMLTGTWTHRVIVIGAVSGPPVAVGAQRTEDVRFAIDETVLVGRRIDDGAPVLALRIESHIAVPGVDDVAPAGGITENLVCETPQDSASCLHWWERSRMRVDTTEDLIGALPLAGTIEPAACPGALECDARRGVPERAPDGTLAWTLVADYLVHACEAPTTCNSIVRVRHELRRID